MLVLIIAYQFLQFMKQNAQLRSIFQRISTRDRQVAFCLAQQCSVLILFYFHIWLEHHSFIWCPEFALSLASSISILRKQSYNLHQLYREKVVAKSYQCFKETHDGVVIFCPTCWLNRLRFYLFLGKILRGQATDICWILQSSAILVLIDYVLPKREYSSF